MFLVLLIGGVFYNFLKCIVCDAYCMLMSNTSTILSTNCCFCFGVIVYASILLLALYNILIVIVVIG